MALLFMEGFSWTTDRNDLVGKWINESGANLSSTGGRFYGGAQPLTSSINTMDVSCSDPGTTNKLIVGWALKRTGTEARTILYFRDDTSNMLLIKVGTDGTITAETTVVVSTCTSTLPNDGGWHYLEVKVLLSATVGTVNWQFDGSAAGSDTGLDTIYAGTACDRIRFGGVGTGGVIDDIYIGDTSSSFDFLGDVTIETKLPNANDSVQFTGSPETTNTYQNVDETSPDDNTSYNESNTSTHQDTFDFPAWSMVSADTIHGVGVNCFAQKVDAGAADLSLVCKSDTTTDVGSALSLGVGYASRQTIWEDDPDAAAAWTKTTLEAAKFGYKRS